MCRSPFLVIYTVGFSHAQSAAEGKCISNCQERGLKLKVLDIASAPVTARQLQEKGHIVQSVSIMASLCLFATLVTKATTQVIAINTPCSGNY